MHVRQSLFLKGSSNENNEYYMSNNGILYNKSITELLKVPPKSAVVDFNIPNTVTAISKSALSSCASLETVTIPPSVINIEKTVFTDCNSLKNINADAENEYYTSIDGILYDKNKTVLMAVPKKSAAAKLDLPDTVETIGEDAASKCEALTEVIFPENDYLNNLYGCKYFTALAGLWFCLVYGCRCRGDLPCNSFNAEKNFRKKRYYIQVIRNGTKYKNHKYYRERRELNGVA